MTKSSRFASKFSKEKWARDLALYKEFTKLSEEPDSSRTEITRHLMKKYGLHSESSVWYIRKKVEKKLATSVQES